ncbi:segmentation protein cap'n'collar isoform X2 [Drosophila innubila]|nr:segmentation protein cap'n'collar isoform X2 [Drosophila innubila]
MVDNSTSNNSSVLGLPSSGHVSNAGSSTVTGGNHANVNAVPGGGVVGVGVGAVAGGGGVSSMSGAGAVGGAGGMTSDLLANGGGAQGGADRLDASSDSAVSSMGSERVPSLSDGEWGEGSDSAQDYHQAKYGGPYDFSYNNTRQPPVAQKKHQLYGKRDLHKQTPSSLPPTAPPVAATAQTQSQQQQQQQSQVQSIKYEFEAGPTTFTSMQRSGSVGEAAAMAPVLAKDYHQAYGMSASSAFTADYGMPRAPLTPQDLVQLNHTYALPHATGSLPQGSGSLTRPQARDKKPVAGTKQSSKSSSNASSLEDEHLSRDEKRARSLNIPIPVLDIINLPMDEFNERLSKYDLSENQLSLIRDIRRRGKNKVAAQNCRKRKLDQILTLEDEVNTVVKRKTQLNQDRDHLESERKRISHKFSMLHRHVFQYLRDPEGNPCSPTDYSLQQAADGSVYLLPRDKTNDSGNTATAAASAAAAPQASLHSHQSHHQVQQQTQHVPLQQQQQQSRLPPHLQQQQATTHHQLLPQQQQQQQQQSQQQQQQAPHQHQHHKE